MKMNILSTNFNYYYAPKTFPLTLNLQTDCQLVEAGLGSLKVPTLFAPGDNLVLPG